MVQLTADFSYQVNQPVTDSGGYQTKAQWLLVTMSVRSRAMNHLLREIGDFFNDYERMQVREIAKLKRREEKYEIRMNRAFARLKWDVQSHLGTLLAPSYKVPVQVDAPANTFIDKIVSVCQVEEPNRSTVSHSMGEHEQGKTHLEAANEPLGVTTRQCGNGAELELSKQRHGEHQVTIATQERNSDKARSHCTSPAIPFWSFLFLILSPPRMPVCI